MIEYIYIRLKIMLGLESEHNIRIVHKINVY